MEKKHKLEDLIKKYLASPYKEETIRLIKKGIRIHTKYEKKTRLGQSKFGGLPDLPIGVKYPNDKNGVPYIFNCQVNLSEVTKWDSNNQLPPKGMLYFFYPQSLNNNQQIVHFYQDDSNLKNAVAPPSKVEQKNIKNFLSKILRLNYDDYKILPEASIEFKIDYSIPSYNSLYYEKIYKEKHLKLKPVNSFNDEKYFEDLIEESNAHQLLGHYRGIQNEYIQLYISSIIKKKIEKLRIKDIDELLKWKLLLQIDADERLMFYWGDYGKLYYFIHEEDLKNHDFAKVKVYLDTT